MENDNIIVKKLLKKLLIFYTRNIKIKKLDYFQKWRKNILYLQRPKLKQTKSYHLPSKKYLRLYEDYKFKETYLEALKILYQIREGDNCPFHPVINNNKCYMTFKTENSIINNRIKKLNNKRKNTNSFHRLSQSYSLLEKNLLLKEKEQREKEEEENYIKSYRMNSNISNFNKNINKSKKKSKLIKELNNNSKSNESNNLISTGFNSQRNTKKPNSLYIQTNTKPSSDISSKISISQSKIKEEKSRNYNKGKNNFFTPTQSTINTGNSKNLFNQFLSGQKNSNSLNIPIDKSNISEVFDNKTNKSINLPVLSYLIDKKNNDKNNNNNNNNNNISNNKSGPYFINDNSNNNILDSNDFSTMRINSKEFKKNFNHNHNNNNNNDNSTKMKSLISKVSNDSPSNYNNQIHNRIFSYPQNLKMNLQDSENDKNEKNKFSIVSKNLFLKADHSRSSFISLQSVTDEKLLKEANSYLTSDHSLENFQKSFKNFKKKKNEKK